MCLVLTICHILRLYKCEHCTLTYSNKIMSVWFFFLGGRWFSKILHHIWAWYAIILTIPYRGRWVVWKRPKTPLRNIKMVPYLISHYHHSSITQATHVFKGVVFLFVSETDDFDQIGDFLVVHDLFVRCFSNIQQFT